MPNRLATESSPYLRQHADNPVDWYPWGEEALARARAENRPILLSIGYSACHWCHVMAHESFEDPATAELMNALYVNVKVDREERPDLDKLYQLAHQALARRGGGWPLTVFLTPDDQLPFFAGTYFPNTPRHGMPAFTQVLHALRQWYDERPDEVRQQNAALASFLADYLDPAPEADAAPDAGAVERAARSLEQLFDARHGGFGRAPKFPHASDLELLLALGGERAAQVERTLAGMAAGGIHDQLGGGFCRYSVDERWEIPHFEKMLYDNAQLLPLYAHAARRFGRPEFEQAARGIVAWAQREMRARDGGWYAALDADSEGVEGRYYVWDRAQAEALLEPELWAVAEPYYGFDRAPNFEAEHWNPIVATPLAAVAARLDIALDEAERRLGAARAVLLRERERRLRPGTDDKVLAAWNALWAGGLARASSALREPAWLDLALGTIEFLERHAYVDGRLQASWKEGHARFPAYLDDHALLLEATLEVLARQFTSARLTRAIALAETLLERFEDPRHGGFWFTAHDHEQLIGRAKPVHDEALPSGNGVAARALLALGHLLGETRYLEAAERALRFAAAGLREAASGSASLLLALRDYVEPPSQTVIRLGGDAESDAAWRARADALRADGQQVWVIPADAGDLPGLLAQRQSRPGGVAYVCRGANCEAPVTEPAALR
jgi:hypothetical protein